MGEPKRGQILTYPQLAIYGCFLTMLLFAIGFSFP